MIKYLKRLCISLLIGLPILFVNFSNAFNEVIVGEATNIGNYEYNFTSNGSMFTNDNPLLYMFWSASSPAGNTTTNMYAWKNGGLYFYGRGNYDGSVFQGYIDKFCVNEDYNNCINGTFDTNLEDIINISPTIEKVVFGNYGGNYPNNPSYLCFYDGINFYCASCSALPNSGYGCRSGITGDSLNINGSSIDDLSFYSWDSSPIVSSKVPQYDILENEYTYGQIVEGYESCGLDVGYCYGGFPHDDIFEPNETIEDFTGYKFGYGANIRYLYSLYSDTYTPKEFFQQMLQAYNNGQINRFKTEPKALIMFVQQYVSGKSRGLLNVGFYDLWDYCNIKLGYTDLNSIYTGNNKTPVACYKNKITNEIPQGGFQFTGDNAYTSIVGTGGSGYTNASDFFGNISSMFQNGIGTVNTNYSGIIPSYILLFMFALILLRIIQH